MKKRVVCWTLAAIWLMAGTIAAQDSTQTGFVISLKNGSSVRGRVLTRDETTGKLRLAMTDSSYAVIAAEDTAAIQSSASASDSISIKLKGGSELRCKEFALSGEVVTVKMGTATRV